MYKIIYKTNNDSKSTQKLCADLEILKEALSVYDLQLFRLSALLLENLPQLLSQDCLHGSSEQGCFRPLGLLLDLGSHVDLHHELRHVHHPDPDMRIVDCYLGRGREAG